MLADLGGVLLEKRRVVATFGGGVDGLHVGIGGHFRIDDDVTVTGQVDNEVWAAFFAVIIESVDLHLGVEVGVFNQPSGFDESTELVFAPAASDVRGSARAERCFEPRCQPRQFLGFFNRDSQGVNDRRVLVSSLVFHGAYRIAQLFEHERHRFQLGHHRVVFGASLRFFFTEFIEEALEFRDALLLQFCRGGKPRDRHRVTRRRRHNESPNENSDDRADDEPDCKINDHVHVPSLTVSTPRLPLARAQSAAFVLSAGETGQYVLT